MWKVFFILFGILAACGRAEAQTSFMPPNDLWKDDSLLLSGGIDQVTFNSVINQVVSVYKPIVRNLGGNLVSYANWADPTVNAYADRDDGNWNISFFGGLARRAETTRLGFMMVVCHELAHHIGSYPTYPGEPFSDEGNSDYLGVHACMKTVLASTKDNVAYLSSAAVAKCKRYYQGQALRVCYNIMSGADSCASLLAALNGSPKPRFDQTDTHVVNQTSHEHPAALCRLNTMSNAAVCKAPWDPKVLPSRSNYLQYSCSMGKEDFRPRCWFAG